MIDWKKPGHAAVPIGPLANVARTSASSATSSARSGVGGAGRPEPLDGGVEEPRDAAEVERAGQEPLDRHVVGGDEGGRGARAGDARLAGDAQRREPVGVGRPEVEPGRRDQVGRGGRRRPAVGVGHGVLDGKSHIRGAQLGLEGAVDEADGGVDDALRVDDHLDRVVVDIVQPVRLDDLQALVGEGRRIDGDLGAHRPGRVLEGLLGCDGGHLVGGCVKERAAGRREHERRDARHGFADEALPDGRVLRIDRA